jgi:multidrug efflux pump subunit AcrA (membrane-fusion protein)
MKEMMRTISFFHDAGPTRLLALAALVSPLVLLPGCKKEKTVEAQVTVQAEQPEHGAISETVAADAVLAPIAQAAIESKITAPIKKFLVQRGQRVKAGELLAELENSDLTAAAMDNQGAYQAAQAAYANATKAQVPQDQLKAESDLAQAKANLALSQSIVNSRKQLFQEGAIPGRDLDTAQAALVETQAAYDAAAKHLDSMRSVTYEAALQQAKGELASADGKLKGAQAQVSYSEIRSPIAGFVTDRPLFAGETAAAGAPLITVMDTTTLLAKAHISQALAQQLKIGGAAEVHAQGFDDATPAKVSMISPALDPGSTTVEVWLKIDNHNGRLKVGTPVKVSITARTVENALKIPGSAILTADDGTKSVMVIVEGEAQRKKVTLGITDGDDVQVLSGLDASDQVIIGGAYGLDPGTKVKIGKADSGDDDKGAKGGDDK